MDLRQLRWLVRLPRTLNIMSAALPVVLSRFERYSTPAAEEKLSELFGLAWDQQMQDWDLTNANPELLPSLLVLLQQQELSDDEEFAAMVIPPQNQRPEK